jgi:DNA-binding transcriptional regulator YiaG
MKTFQFHLQEGKDILIEVPDELEITREEVFALAALETQEQIADGNVQIIRRVWPCLYCKAEYETQGELVHHLTRHAALIKSFKELLAHLYKKPDQKITVTEIPASEKTDGARVRQLRSSLGESQAEFAQRFNVSQNLVSRWETNKSQPPQEVLEWQPPQSNEGYRPDLRENVR